MVTTAIAGWKPSTSAGPCVAPPVLALITAVATASPSAPPTCSDVLTRPDASPCSWLAMPAVACMLKAGNESPKPIPTSSIVGRNTPA